MECASHEENGWMSESDGVERVSGRSEKKSKQEKRANSRTEQQQQQAKSRSQQKTLKSAPHPFLVVHSSPLFFRKLSTYPHIIHIN